MDWGEDLPLTAVVVILAVYAAIVSSLYPAFLLYRKWLRRKIKVVVGFERDAAEDQARCDILASNKSDKVVKFLRVGLISHGKGTNRFFSVRNVSHFSSGKLRSPYMNVPDPNPYFPFELSTDNSVVYRVFFSDFLSSLQSSGDTTFQAFFEDEKGARYRSKKIHIGDPHTLRIISCQEYDKSTFKLPVYT